MQKFTGTFYNGQFSAGYNSEITLTPEGIKINYSNQGNNEFITWNIEKINRIDIYSKEKLIITCNSIPLQSLDISSESLIDSLKQFYPKKTFFIKNHYKQSKKRLAIIVSSVVFFVGLLVLLYFYAIPILAESFASKIPFEVEKKIGSQIYNQLIEKVIIDSSKTRLSQMFFDSLHFIGSEQTKITVIKNKNINAFALPGGYIVVCDSILYVMKAPEEYAALLAHEYSHIKLRHSMRVMLRNIAGNLLLSMIFRNAKNVLSIFINNADALKSFQYSRKLERQADEYAIDLLIQSKVNPNGMVHLFKDIKRKNNQGSSEFLSTHPLFYTRLAYLKAKIDTLQYTSKDNKNLDRLWETIKSGK
jgi:predicted Zn-dependent protease